MDKDISLMLDVKQGNLKAFEELYLCYQKPIANFFFRLGCDFETSEDYTQEVFLRLWKARNSYEPTAKFTTFLFQIAKNYWINERDKKRRRPAVYHIEDSQKSDHAYGAEEIADTSRPPQEKILKNELREKIQEAIDSLKEKHKLVFILSEVEGMRYKEIAEILDIPIGTVKSRMSIAEKKLRKKLQPYLSRTGKK